MLEEQPSAQQGRDLVQIGRGRGDWQRGRRDEEGIHKVGGQGWRHGGRGVRERGEGGHGGGQRGGGAHQGGQHRELPLQHRGGGGVHGGLGHGRH